MKQLYKFSSNYLSIAFLPVVILCTVTWKNEKHYTKPAIFCSALTNAVDTPPVVKPFDTLRIDTSRNNNITDTSKNKITTDTFSLKLSKDTLDAPVYYEAEDSAVVLIQGKKIILYGKTKTDYKDITLTAPKVDIDQEKQMLMAVNSKDSLGDVIERAKFKSGEENFQSDTIWYNFKTQRGLTKNTFTNSGEFFVNATNAKLLGNNTFFASNGIFTTCNLDDPHFGFRFNKIKVINNKLAVSGPVHPEFEHVPIPIYLPFGFFPLSKGRHSGFLPPQFTTNEKFGLGLEGLGYYKVLNEYIDVTVRTNIYSYGGWSASFTPSYRKRYRYNGQLNVNLQKTKFNFKGDPDYVKSNGFQINWSHSVDSRARPGTTFSASVTAGSTKYNQYVPNNANINFNNSLNSSIAWSKTWAGKPYNLSINANHNQNNQQRLININLPDVGFSVNTIYPFQKKEFAGTPKWYEKLGIAYNGSLRNQFSFYDTAAYGKNGRPTFIKHLLDTLEWGAQHNIPITLSLPPILGGAVLVSPGISYSETWFSKKTIRTWNNTTKKLDTTTAKGIYTERQASFSLGFSTALFGTFNFKNGKAIRHVIRPTVGFSYKPDIAKNNYYTEQSDTLGNKLIFSRINPGFATNYRSGKSGSINFAIDNNLEMKYRSKKDTGEAAIKKIKLIDGYGISSSYDLLRDSLKLAPFNLYFRSTLFEKINITAQATLDPYQVNSRGFQINKFLWQDGKGFRPGRITNGSISMSTNFKSKPKDDKKEEERKKEEKLALNDPSLLGDQQRLLEYAQRNPGEFVDFNIPWSLSIGLSLYFNQVPKPDYSGFTKDFSANANFNGDFNLTPKWKFGLNGYYDFETKKLQTFTMNISREMHCWQMTIGVTPIGLYRFFNFTISPKASVLQDLKINRTRTFNNF
jgi:LPS-assembly protein